MTERCPLPNPDLGLSGPASFAMKIRVPAWADGTNSVTVNGDPVGGVAAGTYITIDRKWATGDKVGSGG